MLQVVMQTQKLRLKIVRHLENVGQINNAFVDDAQYINIAMPMYNLIEHSDNYSHTSGSLCNLKEMK